MPYLTQVMYPLVDNSPSAERKTKDTYLITVIAPGAKA